MRGGSCDALAMSLSGGNQQKVVIAREIAEEPKVLIAAQPTRGLDVGAIEFVHRRLVEQRDAGRVAVGGADLTGKNARMFLDHGVGHIPEDRHRRGLVLDFSLSENLVLHDYDKKPFSERGFLRLKAILDYARRLLTEFDVRGGRPETRASALSGGNQQKVVIAREVSRDPTTLIAAQPTRGLDVGAIEFVHRWLVEERDEGRGILLVSLELDEILSLSDRILVIYEGRIAGEYPPDVSEEELGLAMTGGRSKEAA